MNEPIERLAERITERLVGKYAAGGYLKIHQQSCCELIADFLRSHNIDPATLRPATQTDEQMAERIADESRLAAAEARVRGLEDWFFKANKALPPFVETFQAVKNRMPPQPTTGEQQ